MVLTWFMRFANTTSINTQDNTFPLARMSRLIRVLTFGLFAIPVLFLWVGVTQNSPIIYPGLLVAAIYLWVWLRYRPLRFVIHPDAVEIVWPLRKRRIARHSITAVRRIEGSELKGKLGFCMRIGVGGLWGGFGWLWSRRLGIVQMYISRTDGFVWIERGDERSWLLTPERPDEFARTLAD